MCSYSHFCCQWMLLIEVEIIFLIFRKRSFVKENVHIFQFLDVMFVEVLKDRCTLFTPYSYYHMDIINHLIRKNDLFLQ